MNKKLSLLAVLLAVGLYLLGAQTRAETAPKERPWKYRFQQTNPGAPPVQLTASDGSGLQLKLYQAKTVMQGPLAFTELRLTFVNPENRVREDRFQITLPPQAALGRFAMRIDDKWQEAEVVERQAARQAYEDFLHRKQDPALLEKQAGNEFQARVFPIPAAGQKELIISYSQELPSADQPYTLKLFGLPRIEDFEVEAQLMQQGEKKKLLIREKNFAPPGDFQLLGGPQQDSVQSGSLLVTRVTPALQAGSDPAGDALVLVDTSASRALGRPRQLARLRAVVEAWAPKRVSLAAFDQEIVDLGTGTPTELDWNKLSQREALGATDLQRALKWACTGKDHSRLLLVTDGVATAGSTQLLDALKGGPFERVDVLLVGGINDQEKMALLARQGGKHEGLVVPESDSPQHAAEALNRGVTSGLEVNVQDAVWCWPTTLDLLQPGQSRLVYALLAEGHSGPVKLKVGAQSLEIQPAVFGSSPLLDRSLAIAQISKWQAALSECDDPQEKQKLTTRIVELSTQKRVLSDLTALLVLETEADYARFHIDRKALADILRVGSDGLEVQSRTDYPVAVESPSVGKVPEDKDKVKAEDESVANKADLAITDQVTTGVPAAAPEYDGVEGLVSRSAPSAQRASEQLPANRPVAQSEAYLERRVSAPRPARQESELSTVGVGYSGGSSQPVAARDDGGEEEARLQSDLKKAPALSGPYAQIDALLRSGKSKEALEKARQWLKTEPGNVLALVAVGNCLEAMHQYAEAARVFGSIIDLFPSRADLRRYAGGRLESLGKAGLELAVDSFEKAVEQRPDHVSSHRFLAFGLARQGRYHQAMEACERGLSRRYPEGRFNSYERILKDDLGLLAAAWLAAEPSQKAEIYRRLEKYDAKMPSEPSLRFILTWETDANDVDFHIRDNQGGHAYYSQPVLATGGELYGDVTTGYGPECFAIPGTGSASPYKVDIHYYSRGPMGYGMGQLEILRHDGKGHLKFEERPYLIMQDDAYVSLGRVMGEVKTEK